MHIVGNRYYTDKQGGPSWKRLSLIPDNARYDNVTISPLLLQRGLQIGPIQRNGAAPGVIHTGRFFVLIPLKWLDKLTGVKDKYI
jgi:hypothetical protein